MARTHDPSIQALIQLMPPTLRPARWALWAAASVLDDDLADQQDVAPAERAARVRAWTAALHRDPAAGTSTAPVRHALVDTALRRHGDLSGLHGAMANTRDDTRGRHFLDDLTDRVPGGLSLRRT
ncbi:squalene/phytoene synthase family protein [Streptomyces sp. SID8111]|uniref:squalene/phytoene synthase family protein n=1 Tax=Streptomyces sp. SID8111 TaxID=2706100 RepID=UPI0031BB23C3